MHYAAGFGWKECIDLLIKHGADINAANMWKITPITIAMLKNHQGIVKELLKRDDIDVNGKTHARILPDKIDFTTLGRGVDKQAVVGVAIIQRDNIGRVIVGHRQAA